jgi:Ser/Thr protein kinase RdoA (MazF antagonist)
MTKDIESQLKAIDGVTLTPFVQRALGYKGVALGKWAYQPVIGGLEMSSNLYRFSGDAEAAGKVLPWTLILKIAQAGLDHEDPQGVWYWKRETLAYGSGLLDDLPGGVAAPRCYGTAEGGDGVCWVWMEEVRDEVGEWPLEQYGEVARCLGRFNGAYLAGKPLPDDPWLTRRWLRKYVERAAPAVDLLLRSFDHPLIQRALPGFTVEVIQQIWEQRHAVLQAIERLPQTFCHLDAFRRNLFWRHSAGGGPQVVAVDWSYAGIGAVGEEIAPLVNASVGFGAVQPADQYKLEEIVLQGYLEGLSEAGWRGDPDLVRLGYAATLYWRYAVGAFIGEMIPWMLDERYHAAVEQAMGQSMQENADRTAAVLAFFEYVYAQVSKLMAAFN